MTIAVALLVLGASTAAADGPDIRDVAFLARCDKSTQRYLLILPPRFEKAQPHDLLIALHGHGADRWQIAHSKRGASCAAREIAQQHGLICVAPDYRAKTSWMGAKAEADVLQILDEMKTQYKINRVVLCGGSMGGSSALTFAALHPELVDGVASMNGTANHLEFEGFQEAIAESFGATKAQAPLEYKRRSAEYWPERLTMPVGIAAGGKDTVVPPDSVVRLAKVLQAIGGDVFLIYRPEGGHYTEVEDAKRVLEHTLRQARRR